MRSLVSQPFTMRLRQLIGCALTVACCASCAVSSAKLQQYEQQLALGKAYLDTKDIQNARIAFTQAQDILADDARTYHALALLAQYSGQMDKADNLYTKALEKDIDFAAAHNNYGVLLFNQKKNNAAIVHFRLAAENPEYNNNYVAWINLSRAAFDLEKFKLAADALQQAVKIRDDVAEYRLQMAQLYFKIGEPLFANLAFQKYLALLDSKGKEPTVVDLNLGMGIAKQRFDQPTFDYYMLLKKRIQATLPAQ